MSRPLFSICIASYNHAQYLDLTLASIYAQAIMRKAYCEVIVVNDGSSDDTALVCSNYEHIHGLKYHKLPPKSRYTNSAKARNISYQIASADIIIPMSDDTIHHKPDTIRRLLDIAPGTFNIATVWNTAKTPQMCDLEPAIRSPESEPMACFYEDILYTGKYNKRPFFFLGSLFTNDLYAVGGNSEDFNEPGYEDDWFAECLMAKRGRGLVPVYRDDIIGYHQDHPRSHTISENMRQLFVNKRRDAEAGKIPYCASGGPWSRE